MHIAVIGHPPKQILGIPHTHVSNLIREYLVSQRECSLEYVDIYLNPMIGFWTAKSCLELSIPFRAIIPFSSHYTVWPTTARNEYQILLSKASRRIEVDRQPGFVLSTVPPGVYKKEKLVNLALWMTRQINTDQEDELLYSWRTDIVNSWYRNNFLGTVAHKEIGGSTDIIRSPHYYAAKLMLHPTTSYIQRRSIVSVETLPF